MFLEELNHSICFDSSLKTYLEPTACHSKDFLILVLVHGNFRFVNFVSYLLGCFRDSGYSYYWGTFIFLYYLFNNYLNPSLFLCIHCDHLKPFLYISNSNCLVSCSGPWAHSTYSCVYPDSMEYYFWAFICSISIVENGLLWCLFLPL